MPIKEYKPQWINIPKRASRHHSIFSSCASCSAFGQCGIASVVFGESFFTKQTSVTAAARHAARSGLDYYVYGDERLSFADAADRARNLVDDGSDALSRESGRVVGVERDEHQLDAAREAVLTLDYLHSWPATP